MISPNLTEAYQLLFDELSLPKYEVRTVFGHYVSNAGVPSQKGITVVLRIDVDDALHLSLPLAKHLKERGLTGSHFFLTRPKRYYDIWSSNIPRSIHQLGQEVGLHSDHYFEQLKYGVDGLIELKNDIRKLSALIGDDIKGMVYHGHDEMNEFGTTNWELTKNLHPEELGLKYHDGLKSCYIKSNVDHWTPRCDAKMSDFVGLKNGWGWNYFPKEPTKNLKNYVGNGQVVHIAIHTSNAFEYWKNWTSEFGEAPRKKHTVVQNTINKLELIKFSFLRMLLSQLHPSIKIYFKEQVRKILK